MNAKLLAAIVAGAMALAGCASDPETDPSTGTPSTTTPATSTPATSTPAGSTPATSTPAVTTPATNSTPPKMKDCPEPPAAPANATGAMKMGYPELVYTVQEPRDDDGCFAFVGPASAPAGWTAITLQNNGRAPHIMPILRLDAGKTLADVKAAFAAGESPAWAVPVGGVGFATPFSNGTVLMNLTAGTYVVVCFFDNHHLEGMYRTLNVTAAPADATPRAAPTANLTIEMDDFKFDVPANVTAGMQVVRFVNNGTQPHEAPLIALQGNTTLEQFLAAIENPQGPPPGAGVGGVNVLAPGMTAYGIVDFKAGGYGLVCFVEDPGSHKPHVALGMARQFNVTA